jgi:hypothetical protein
MLVFVFDAQKALSSCKETKKGRNTQNVSSFFCDIRCDFNKISAVLDLFVLLHHLHCAFLACFALDAEQVDALG